MRTYWEARAGRFWFTIDLRKFLIGAEISLYDPEHAPPGLARLAVVRAYVGPARLVWRRAA